MTQPTKPDSATQTPHQDVSVERISRLISDLEQELANANVPHADELREEIGTLKQILASPEENRGWVNESLHKIHRGLQGLSARVEGEVLRDSPYVAEIGRILGLV